MAASLAPAICDCLQLTSMGRFLALTPQGGAEAVQLVAQTCVRDLDGFRAPVGEQEMARRRAAGLSARQDALLVEWGYPYVMEEFKFHLTLSGLFPDAEIPTWTENVLRFLPDLPMPFILDQIALCGEREDGRFEVIHRYKLTG